MAEKREYHLGTRLAPARSYLDDGVRGLTIDDVTQETAVVASKHNFKGSNNIPLVTPIYHSSTYIVEKMEQTTPNIADGSPIYSRLANPTTEMTECAINDLERGAGSLVFSSGMAAVTSVFLGFLRTGDHVIYQLPSYPGTITALKHMRDFYKVELTAIQNVTVEKIADALKPNTTLVWLETPCNPNVTLVDVEAITNLVKPKGVLVGIDGTFGTPCCQQLMKYGIDFSMHSCTKYMGGHSDLIGGCLTTRTVEQWRILKHLQGTFGNMLSPHDASMLLRGLRTLPIRMKKHSENALKVAEYLEQHPKVERVHYPGLKSHPQYEIAKKQMTNGGSAMIMAEIKGGSEGGATVAENVRVFSLAVSLGGVQSILEHPYSMTHGPYLLTPEETAESGVTPGMLRISVGIEDADDLIADFQQALEKVKLS